MELNLINLVTLPVLIDDQNIRNLTVKIIL